MKYTHTAFLNLDAEQINSITSLELDITSASDEEVKACLTQIKNCKKLSALTMDAIERILRSEDIKSSILEIVSACPILTYLHLGQATALSKENNQKINNLHSDITSSYARPITVYMKKEAPPVPYSTHSSRELFPLGYPLESNDRSKETQEPFVFTQHF